MKDVSIRLRTWRHWDGELSRSHAVSEDDAEAIRQIRRAIHARPELRAALIKCAMSLGTKLFDVRFTAEEQEKECDET